MIFYFADAGKATKLSEAEMEKSIRLWLKKTLETGTAAGRNGRTRKKVIYFQCPSWTTLLKLNLYHYSYIHRCAIKTIKVGNLAV